MEISYIIIFFLILSISINIIIFLIYIKKRGLTKFTKTFPNTQSKMYKKFLIPEIYTKDSLQFSFKKNVTDKDSFSSWKNTLITKFQELHNLPNFHDLKIKLCF